MYKENKKYIAVTIIFIIIIVLIIYYIDTNEDNEIVINNNEELLVKNENSTQIEATKEEYIFVHISGAVNNEGVIEIQSNSRIKDAIEMAGGLKENADISNINLAELLEDGTKIYIQSKEENKEDIQRDVQITNTITNKKENGVVNINTANQTELETLPGIGASIALKIINYRKENGKFVSIEDIKKVSGIGESKFNAIKDFIKVK